MKTTFRFVFLVVAILALARVSANGQTAFTYQGQLSDSGAPAQGLYDLRFKLFSDTNGTTQAGSTVFTNGVAVTNGLFTVSLDFGSGVFNGSNYWLGIGVDTNGGTNYTDLAPLQQITPTPYALFAANAGAVSGGALGGLYGGAVSFTNAADQFTGAFIGNGASLSNVSAQTLSGLGASNFWLTVGNAGTSPTNGNFIGTTDEQPLEARVDGWRLLRLEPDQRTAHSGNIVGGWVGNAVQQPNSGGDFIGAGGYGSSPNIIASNSSDNVIAGGAANYISTGINHCVIGGGYGNVVTQDADVIGGGYYNDVLEVTGVVGGGTENAIGSSADNSFIGGGEVNTINGSSNLPVGAVIVGGYDNTIETNSSYPVIGGGYDNLIGSNTVAATIPGGYENEAFGTNSFAAGYEAEALTDSSFVWAGGNSNAYPSTLTASFNVYAAGGASFDYGGQDLTGRGVRSVYIGPAVPGQTITAWNGAYLSDSGVWESASDKNRKTDFQDVDSGGVLDKLAALPVRQWRYTNEAVSIKHIGPTAQDFKAAFGLGEGDRAIGTVDEGGVALAALQALNQKLHEQGVELQAENEALKRQNQSLAARLDALAEAVQRLSARGQEAP